MTPQVISTVSAEYSNLLCYSLAGNKKDEDSQEIKRVWLYIYTQSHASMSNDKVLVELSKVNPTPWS